MSIYEAILVTLVCSCVKAQSTVSEGIVLSGPLEIHGVQLDFKQSYMSSNADLFEQIKTSLCKYALESKNLSNPLPYRCDVEYTDQVNLYFTTKLSVIQLPVRSRSAFRFDNTPVTHLLKLHQPLDGPMKFEPVTGKTLISIYGKVTWAEINLFGFCEFNTRPTESFLSIERDLCDAIESRRSMDPKFRNILPECLVISEGNGYAFHMFLIFSNEDLKNAGISPDPDAVGVAVQHAFLRTELNQGLLKYKGLIFDIPKKSRITHFLLRGPILRNSQVVQFGSEEQISTSTELPNLTKRICDMVSADPSWTGLYPNHNFNCQIKAYDKTNSHVTILVTAYGSRFSPYIPFADAVERLGFSFTNDAFTWSPTVVNQEILAPKQIVDIFPPPDVEVAIIKLPARGMSFDVRSKDSVVGAFQQVNNRVCQAIKLKMADYPRLTCKVLSFDPIGTTAMVELTLPMSDLPEQWLSLGEIYSELLEQ